MKDPKTRKMTRKRIVSAVLEDGSLLETVYRPSDHKTAFVVSRSGRVEERAFLRLPRLGPVAPYSPDNNLLAHRVVLLPSAADPYESEEELLLSVRRFIHRYADLSDSFEEVATYFVLLTWVYDAFSEVPYLRLKGDFGSGKSRCLLTIGSLCYKPIFASGASTVSPLFRILDAFQGTLIVDESDFRLSDEKAEIIKILNNGNAAGFPVLRSEVTPSKEFNPTAFSVFGPKIIATRRSFADDALESRCITETMSGLPPRADIPLSLPHDFHAEAAAIRNQLLTYRFRQRSALRELNADRDEAVEPRVAQVMAPLLAVVDDDQARERIRSLARTKSRVLAAERSATVEAQLLDIMIEMRRASLPLGIKAISDRFSERFGGDYHRPITPRWIGAQLRSRLSLVSMKTNGMFVIPPTEGRKIESLGRRYGLVNTGGFGDVGDVARPPAGDDHAPPN